MPEEEKKKKKKTVTLAKGTKECKNMKEIRNPLTLHCVDRTGKHAQGIGAKAKAHPHTFAKELRKVGYKKADAKALTHIWKKVGGAAAAAAKKPSPHKAAAKKPSSVAKKPPVKRQKTKNGVAKGSAPVAVPKMKKTVCKDTEVLNPFSRRCIDKAGSRTKALVAKAVNHPHSFVKDLRKAGYSHSTARGIREEWKKIAPPAATAAAAARKVTTACKNRNELKNPLTQRCIDPSGKIAHSLAALATNQPQKFVNSMIAAGYSKNDAMTLREMWAQDMSAPAQAHSVVDLGAVARRRPSPAAAIVIDSASEEEEENVIRPPPAAVVQVAREPPRTIMDSSSDEGSEIDLEISDIEGISEDDEPGEVAPLKFPKKNRAHPALNASDKYFFVLGAGASADAGIPTFRGQDRSMEDMVKEAEDLWKDWYAEGEGWHPLEINEYATKGFTVSKLLSQDTYEQYPIIFEHVWKTLVRGIAGKKPGAVHHTMKALHDAGKLAGVYSMNIDNLEFAVGLPNQKVLLAHGTALMAERKTTKDLVPILESKQIDIKTMEPMFSLYGGVAMIDDSNAEDVLQMVAGNVMVFVGVSGAVLADFLADSQPSRVVYVNPRGYSALDIKQKLFHTRDIPSDSYDDIKDMFSDLQKRIPAARSGSANTSPDAIKRLLAYYGND